MNRHLVFVSYELYPVNAGGCGVFIANAVTQLLREFEDIEITLLLDMALSDVEKFNTINKPNIIGKERLRCVCVSEILKNVESEISFIDLKNIYLWKSYQFYRALQCVHNNIKNIDYIEFFDYVGIGFYAIRAQKYQRCFGECLTAVRAHCTIDLMDIEQKQIDFNEEKITMYQMEKMCLQDCDILLSPSECWADLYCRRYGLLNKKVLISPPPLNPDNIFLYEVNKNQADVLFYGRIFELKGVDVFVDAAIMYLLQNTDSKTNFYLVGYSSNTLSGESYEKYLIEKIPQSLRKRFIFTGQLNKTQLNDILKSIAVAVFPNYVESFCYSIHEIYQAGVPIICRNIPAFKDYFTDSKNCLYFDGTASNLAKNIQLILEDYKKRMKLSYPYKVLDNNLFKNSYKAVIKIDKKINTCDNSRSLSTVSLILIDNCNNNEKLSINWDINLVSKTTSYRLVPVKNKIMKNDVIVWFLGSKWIAKPLFEKLINPKLPLSKYIWIGYYDDNVIENYFENILKCFHKSNELQFVNSYMINKNNKSKYCYQVDIDCYNSYKTNNYGLRTVYLNRNNLNLRDYLDNRLEELSIKTQLHNGYTIPEFLIEIVNTKNMKINSELLVLFLHQLSRNEEWNPFDLYPLIKKINTKEKNNFIREVYHKVKMYADSRNGLLGKITKKVISIVYKILKR